MERSRPAWLEGRNESRDKVVTLSFILICGLDEEPDIVGLSVPGMPVGSPGMEIPGRQPERYDVLAFDEDGNTRVYASR